MNRTTDGILYCIVANTSDGSIAAEASRTKSNVVALNAKKVFNSLPKAKAEKRSYNYEGSCYNILYEAGTMLMAVTAEEFSRVQCFTFLEEVKKQWMKCGRNGEMLQPELKRQMDYFSDPANDKWKKLKNNIEEVKEVMIDNIEKMVERGERIDKVCEQTEALERHAGTFQKRATTLSRKMWWKSCKLTIAIILVVLIIALVISVFACRETGPTHGAVNWDKCKATLGGGGTHDTHHDHGNSTNTKNEDHSISAVSDDHDSHQEAASTTPHPGTPKPATKTEGTPKPAEHGEAEPRVHRFKPLEVQAQM